MTLYGLMMVLAVVTAMLIAINRSSVYNLKKDDIFFGMLYALIGFIIGAKVFFLISISPLIARNFQKIISDTNLLSQILLSGYSFFGGVIGGGLGAYIYNKQYKLPWWAFVNTVLPGLPLALSVGRIGCFLTGCCYGKESCTFGITMNHSKIAPHDVKLIPVQLLESLVGLVIFFILIKMKKKEDNTMLLTFIACYSTARLVLEQLRYHPPTDANILGISVTSWLCIGLLLFSVTTLLLKTVQEKSDLL